jgi:four helix bundle protein
MESVAASQMTEREVLVSGCGKLGVGSGRNSVHILSFSSLWMKVGRHELRRQLLPHPTPHIPVLKPRYNFFSPPRISRSVCTNQDMSDSIYRRLEVWRESVQLAIETYTATQDFPRHELYGLSAQMRRAAVSIPSNIAEGRGRGTKRDFCRFVQQARGSLFELQTQLTIAEALGYATPERVGTLTRRSETVARLLNGLVRYLQRPSQTNAPTPYPPHPTPHTPHPRDI